MGQTLTNGIYLPNEGERNCYSGLAANWNAVDTLKGNYSLHAINVDIHVTSAEKETWNGKADNSALTAHTGDTTIHVTSEDKEAWNSKADASALTAHTGDTTIHVTSADKQAWNSHVADSVKHVTAEDKAKWDAVTTKADDSGVVHKSGDEDVNGTKTFKDMIPIDGDYIGDEASTNQRTNICLRSNRDTANKSCAYITRFRQNRSQGALQTNDLQKIGFDVLENGVRTNNVFDIQCTGWLNDVPQIVNFISSAQSYSWGGSSKKALINGLNPGSLGMPSGNTSDMIDISSYITLFDGTNNSYTPPADGWICISGKNCTAIYVYRNNYWGVNSFSPTADTILVAVPVVSGVTFAIKVIGRGLNYAKFIPCQGNV